MNPRYLEVAARAGHRCEYCRAPEAMFNFPFEIDHILPLQQGGNEIAENWALACRSCNLFKGLAIEALDPATGATVRLFHPRVDVWQQHFAISRDEGAINGITPIGRATMEKLRLNAVSQVMARRQWARLGLFP